MNNYLLFYGGRYHGKVDSIMSWLQELGDFWSEASGVYSLTPTNQWYLGYTPIPEDEVPKEYRVLALIFA